VGVPEGLPFPRLNGYARIWNLPDKKEPARETQQGRRESAGAESVRTANRSPSPLR
jgi:hypothetical protein